MGRESTARRQGDPNNHQTSGEKVEEELSAVADPAIR
jgi:hypothetical protein